MKTVEIGEPENVPARAPTRNERYAYPWKTLKPGQWFKFADVVKVESARVMACNAAANFDIRINVFRAEGGKMLIAQRVDGWEPFDRLKVRRWDDDGNEILPAPVGGNADTVPKSEYGLVVEHSTGQTIAEYTGEMPELPRVSRRGDADRPVGADVRRENSNGLAPRVRKETGFSKGWDDEDFIS